LRGRNFIFRQLTETHSHGSLRLERPKIEAGGDSGGGVLGVASPTLPVNVIISPGWTETRFYFQSELGLMANFIFSPGSTDTIGLLYFQLWSDLCQFICCEKYTSPGCLFAAEGL